MVVNQSVLLHEDCNRMLRRPSKILLVNEITYTLFGSINENNKKTKTNINKFDWYEILLIWFGCYKN